MSLLHVVCPSCDGVNRVDVARMAEAKCGKCQQGLFQYQPLALDTMRFSRHISRSDIPVVVDFWAAWCGPCKMMAPIFADVSKQLEPRARFVKVDTEREQQLAAQYGIRSIPTLMIFKGGKELARQAGVLDQAGFKAWVSQYL